MVTAQYSATRGRTVFSYHFLQSRFASCKCRLAQNHLRERTCYECKGNQCKGTTRTLQTHSRKHPRNTHDASRQRREREQHVKRCADMHEAHTTHEDKEKRKRESGMSKDTRRTKTQKRERARHVKHTRRMKTKKREREACQNTHDARRQRATCCQPLRRSLSRRRF